MSADWGTPAETAKHAIDEIAKDLVELRVAVMTMIALRNEVTANTHLRPGWDLEVSAAWERLRALTWGLR